MKAVSRVLLILSAASAMWGCDRYVGPSRQTVPYVESVLAGSDRHTLGLLAASRVPLPSGSIVFIGNSADCNAFAEGFAACDERDNVDARPFPDGLADFAGETLVCISDDYTVDFADTAACRAFRERTVRKVVAALDTLAHVSPFDLEGLIRKPAAKLVILGDLEMCEYGGFDVDTLLRSTSCDIPVVHPVDHMFGTLFDSGRGRAMNIGVIADVDGVADSLRYVSAFMRHAARRGLSEDSRCFVFPSAAEGDSLLHRLVLSYARENRRPLDAVVVDDYGLDVDSLKSELADMISVMSESSMTYGRFLARDFVLMDVFGEVCSACHSILRERNLFTHDISQVQTVSYTPVDLPDSDDGSILLIPVSYVQN